MEFLIRTEKVDESAPEKVKFLFSEKSLAEESRKLEVSFQSGQSKSLMVPSTPIRRYISDESWLIQIFKKIAAWQEAQRQHLQKILKRKMEKMDVLKLEQAKKLKKIVKG